MPTKKRVVIKIGTAVITEKSKSPVPFFRALAAEIGKLRDAGWDVIVVTSGAIGLGLESMKMKSRPHDVGKLQALASIGQVTLMRLYQEIFEKSGLTVSQVLVTRQDFGRRTSYLSLQRTLSTLLKWNAVPVINENDALAADEIRFGDNDILAALVSAKMQTSHLLLLTQTEGFIKDGCVVPVIDRITPEIKAFCSGKSCLGSGGMKSKLEAAHIARKSGASTFIFAGAHPEYISEILLEKKGHGTCIPAEKRLSAKKQWLAYSSLVSGTISVDRGAEEALVKKGRSMLPSGIMKVSGEFGRGDVVGLTGGNGTVFARGITSYSSSEIEKIRGRRSSEIEKILGYTRGEEVIHRDNLTLEHA